MCAALRVGWHATLFKPARQRAYELMDDEYILRGLREPMRLPPTRPDLKVYFSHYHYPHHHTLAEMPRIFLIGFPFDSFYSDGIVYSDKANKNDPRPSSVRAHAANYIFRFGSPEWQFLEPIMRQNAEWLMRIDEREDAIIFRYEDFFLDLVKTEDRLARFIGKPFTSLPPPVQNPRRTYWTEKYSECFDHDALHALWRLFGPAIERFYPEKKSLGWAATASGR